MNTWTIFLDRDGIINLCLIGDYIKSWSEFHFLEGSLEGLRLLAEHPLVAHICIITNQQGVAKGLMSAQNLEEIHTQMCAQIRENGGRIDKIYAATNHNSEQPNRRKPAPLMGLEAKSDFPSICFERSIMLGDTESDIQFGKGLGMRTISVPSNHPNQAQGADFCVSGLLEFAQKLELFLS
jgi:D-glycero-D-manno-heptose 1,7-bisphosphate phosphatase